MPPRRLHLTDPGAARRVRSMEVAAMDAADPLQIRYNMQFSELVQLTLIYIGITAIGQIVAIPVSGLCSRVLEI